MKFLKTYWHTWISKISKTNKIKEKIRYILWLDYFNKKLVKEILKLPRNAQVIDCWCWLWVNILRVKEIRPDLIITWIDIWEIKPKWLDYFISWNIMELTKKINLKEKYDLVINMHVIEHIGDSTDFVENLFYILKKWGALYLESPSIKNIFMLGDLNFYSDPTHIRPYSKMSFYRIWKYFWCTNIKAWYNYPTFIWILISILIIPFLLILRKKELYTYLFVRLFWLHSILLTFKKW